MAKAKWHNAATRFYFSLTKTEQRRYKNKQLAFILRVVNTEYRGWSFLEKTTSEEHAKLVQEALNHLSDWKIPSNA